MTPQLFDDERFSTCAQMSRVTARTRLRSYLHVHHRLININVLKETETTKTAKQKHKSSANIAYFLKMPGVRTHQLILRRKYLKICL